jgi:hypothetical protein
MAIMKVFQKPWLVSGWISLLLAASTLMGCSALNPPVPPTPFPVLAYTIAAQTIVAELTLNAPPTPLPLPTDTLAPTSTPTILPTNTPVVLDLPSPTSTPLATNTPVPEIVFQDDFSNDTGWFTDQDEDMGFQLARDGYLIYVNILNAPIFSIRERQMSAVQLEVDGTILNGGLDGFYGVVCRHSDSSGYYALVIGGDGSYGIAKSVEGDYEFLQTGQAPESVIVRGRETNRVRGDCNGDTLTLFANGQELLEVQDDDFEIGSVGVLAGTRLSGPITVLFDNFVIYRP